MQELRLLATELKNTSYQRFQEKKRKKLLIKRKKERTKTQYEHRGIKYFSVTERRSLHMTIYLRGEGNA